MTTPGGTSDCPKDVVSFGQLAFGVVCVLAEVEHGVKGDTEYFGVVCCRKSRTDCGNAKWGSTGGRKVGVVDGYIV